ncbi:uncharacterized protein J4E87_008861 [Alternaria ethzedia]|uniref:uncharacterized protein n=1 Tax=Alternaria ethzedia TaxID=181014 RepID=UPI0020C2E390|nr:uncharacterized protein J4E87_008861 [Alternaria ethzedia]KAI4616126.1 hypothetical protein J4E87_008861 [Alternaria ethzedia]
MTSFRFLDLPREIRDKIYGILLCTFPRPESVTHGTMLSKKDFSPSILRVNKQIYAESYDAMIKRNRFLLVSSTGGLHFAYMLKANAVPTLAFDLDNGTKTKKKSGNKVIKPITQRFRGYAMHITIGNSNPRWRKELPPSELLEPCNVIMLFRDVKLLCEAIKGGDDRLEDYKSLVTLDFELAPVIKRPPYQLEGPTTYFSSAKTQEELLEPFRQSFRDMPRVTISGTVEEPLAKSAKEDFARSKFHDLDAVISSWTARKAEGTQLFKQGEGGCLKLWAGVRDEIDEAHKSDTWKRLIEEGGPSFVTKVAELYYTTNLNIVAIGLKWLEEGDREVLPGIQKSYGEVKSSTEEGYWGVEHSWKPSPAQEMRSTFRYAKFLRLWGESSLVPFALVTINMLATRNPDDAAVLEEQRKIKAWKRSVGPINDSAFNAMMSGLNT